jgi:hypothetical protein
LRVDQVIKILNRRMQNSGRGGFLAGVVASVTPLTITAGKLELDASQLYITDNCIGLTINLQHSHVVPSGGSTDNRLREKVVLRAPLMAGDGVLLLCRPDSADGVKYIILDRIQPYNNIREVTAR